VAFQGSDLFVLYLQILHISDVEVKETKLMGNVPIIIISVSIFFYVNSMF
jgi:hypothetical protein